MSATTKKYAGFALCCTIGLVGCFGSVLGVAYIAGMFGISSALASQIVNAVSIGGFALGIAMTVLSGGTAAAAVATARWAIARWGHKGSDCLTR